MEKLLVALMLVVLAAPAWSDDLNYTRAPEKRTKQDKNQKKEDCPVGIDRSRLILNTDPFNNFDRCYNVLGFNIYQVLSKNKALVSFRNGPVALIDFGKQTVPSIFIDGVVKGDGAFQYVNEGGLFQTVHRLKVVRAINTK